MKKAAKREVHPELRDTECNRSNLGNLQHRWGEGGGQDSPPTERWARKAGK